MLQDDPGTWPERIYIAGFSYERFATPRGDDSQTHVWDWERRLAWLGVLGIPLLFFANLLILFGPLLFFGLKQMKGYEPGDADWGVKLADVRGQAEPKQEVTRVISLLQSGEEFRKAGGKPERGLLFIGAPGTGKTMLSKGIATSFNSPIMMMPGSAFAAGVMGMDVVIVQILVSRARRLALLGVSADEVPELAAMASKQWTATFNPRPVGADGLRQVYERAL